MQTEFVRSLNANYERILLDHKPEEQKYQYCIVGRGGIGGILPCSLRYINGLAYLYYDISSKQNISQCFEKKCISREWMKDFFWAIDRIKIEMKRFLLDESNIMLYPEQIYQDIETNAFYFLYIPYYEGDRGLEKLLEYFIESVDYDDDELVEFVYKIYDNYSKLGNDYWSTGIINDAKFLQDIKPFATVANVAVKRMGTNIDITRDNIGTDSVEARNIGVNDKRVNNRGLVSKEEYNKNNLFNNNEIHEENADCNKKGIRFWWDGYRKRSKASRVEYEDYIKQLMDEKVVAENHDFEVADYGKTIYINEEELYNNRKPCLMDVNGEMIKELDKCKTCLIGKKEDEVDLVLKDISVSRMHAKITKQDDDYYIEDINSTNGTFKNGLRLQPYEKRKLEEDDEIKIGKVNMVYKLI